MSPTKMGQPRSIRQLPADAISRSLYGRIRDLSKSLEKHQSPQSPKNYRAKATDHPNSSGYALSYEDELHLADHFAFLAHVEEGVEFVSAVTLEEHSDPPALVVRLASNNTPSKYVVEGLTKILQHVKDHAREGKDREKYKADLFEEVIRFSKKRIIARLRCKQWIMPKYMKGGTRAEPLYKKIEENLGRLQTPSWDQGERAELLGTIDILIEALKKVDDLTEKEFIVAFQALVRKSSDVSTNANSKSLEDHLKRLKFPSNITQSREVLEIDKLSKYLELCNDLIRHSRKPKTRPLFMNIKLEICKACPGLKLPGNPYESFVHGEVQLVLFYEEHPMKPPPRAIGSSKSACFLCDLFIEKHGGFRISHSHMRLYEKWRIPDTPWMNDKQTRRLENIIRAMDGEIARILNQERYFQNWAMESRAHILQHKVSDIASSIDSPPGSNTQLSVENGHHMHNHDITPALEPILENSVTSTLYYFQDLPISVDIVRTTISCTLLVGNVDYLFDFEDVEKGNFQVCEDTETGSIPNEECVDVRGLDQVSPMRLRCEDGSNISKLHVYDEGRYGLIITFTWIGVDGE